MRRIVFRFSLSVAGLSAWNAQAATYYVANSGNNSNNGLSVSSPFQTIQFAADLVQAGDTVFVSDGVYSGFDLRDVLGTSTAPVVFKASGNSVLINQNGPIREDAINVEDCAYIIIDGFICNDMVGNGNGIRIVTSDFCIVRNNRCDNNAERGIFTGFTDDILIEHNVCTNAVGEHGIYVSNSSDRPVIRYNTCSGNNWAGIHLNGDLSAGEDGIIHDPEIYGNRIFDNHLGAGINMDGVLDAVIYNNLIYDNHSCQGIVLFQIDGAIVSSGAKIYNNTIIVPTDGRWGILLHDGANVNTEIYNNIILNLHSYRGCIGLWSTTQFTSDYNILNDKMSTVGDDGAVISLSAWQALGLDAHSQLADPMTSIFVNPATFDYHLLSTSQAVDAGTSMVASVVQTDFENLIRPWGAGFDIGAYEEGSVLSIGSETWPLVSLFPNPVTTVFELTGPRTALLEGVSVYSFAGSKLGDCSRVDEVARYELPPTVKPGNYILRLNYTDGSVRSLQILVAGQP